MVSKLFPDSKSTMQTISKNVFPDFKSEIKSTTIVLAGIIIYRTQSTAYAHDTCRNQQKVLGSFWETWLGIPISCSRNRQPQLSLGICCIEISVNNETTTDKQLID